MFRDPIRLHPFREPSSQPLSPSSPPAHSGITVLRAYPRGTRVYAPAKKAVNRFHCLRIEMSCPPLSRLRPDATGLAITRISVPFAFREFSLVFFPPILFFLFFSFFFIFFIFFSCIWESVPHRPVWKEGFVTRDKLTVRSDGGRCTP